jgi:hypothetical protein
VPEFVRLRGPPKRPETNQVAGTLGSGETRTRTGDTTIFSRLPYAGECGRFAAESRALITSLCSRWFPHFGRDCGRVRHTIANLCLNDSRYAAASSRAPSCRAIGPTRRTWLSTLAKSRVGDRTMPRQRRARLSQPPHSSRPTSRTAGAINRCGRHVSASAPFDAVRRHAAALSVVVSSVSPRFRQLGDSLCAASWLIAYGAVRGRLSCDVEQMTTALLVRGSDAARARSTRAHRAPRAVPHGARSAGR